MPSNVAFDPMPIAHVKPAADLEFNLVLKSLSHPEMDEIRIEDNLFAIGRSEPPFASCAPDVVAELSRRHARIFSEFGAVYIADLDSKNGTTVNGVAVRQKPSKLHDGDEICFGHDLSFRLKMGSRSATREPSSRLLSVTLTPEENAAGQQPIVIAGFPFLVSKTDAIFSRYREQYPHHVNYISRRHAHIFLKNGAPFIEDLGSTNGTFIGDKRLEEHAVALNDGDLLAFGGHHLVYRVSVQKEVLNDATVTRLSALAAGAASASANADKTTFVAAADSFLDIFCVDAAQQLDDEVNNETAETSAVVKNDAGPRRKRSRFALFAAEMRGVLKSGERTGSRRVALWGGALAAGVALLALGVYIEGGPERELKDLLASGEYAQAATAAKTSLERHPDDAKLKALGTEALLKASVPNWLTLVKSRNFGGAAAAVVAMKDMAVGNDDVQPLVSELAWLGAMSKFVTGRGTGDASIQIYADEEEMGALLKQWDDDVQGHQRAFTAISSQVPEFRDWYAEALSRLRKLQSDNSVYLAAIERMKTTIGTELNRDQPEALDAVFAEYGEKYPRLGGVDGLRQDLRRYIALNNEIRARSLGPLIALLAQTRFSTPPFQERLRTLTASGRLPSAEVIAQYEVASAAWRAGNTTQAVDDLQKLAAGPWADAAAREVEHKQAVVGQFAELQKLRGTKAYDDRLLAFYGTLDAAEDVHFIRATETDLGLIKDQALKRAQELLTRAQARWRQYRDNGTIERPQRLEAEISNPFRTQARLLADAHDDVQTGVRIYTQLKVGIPGAWQGLQDEIKAEVEEQRNALLELRLVLDPGLLKAKLALIGGRSDGQRESP